MASMESLDRVVADMTQPRDTVDALVKLNRNLIAAATILDLHVESLDNVLETMRPGQHTVSMLHIFLAQGRRVREDPDAAWVLSVGHFLELASGEQLRIASKQVVQLLGLMWDVCHELGTYKALIVPCGVAARHTQGSDKGALTPAHMYQMLACVMAKCYGLAVRLYTGMEVSGVNPAASSIQPKHLVSYFYYAGVAAIAMKEYTHALEAFTLLFSVPASTVSAVMIEAYKRYILVSLLVHSKVVPLPRYVSTIFTRHAKVCCDEYFEMASAFGTRSVAALDAALAEGAEAFTADGNWGLAKLTRTALVRDIIARLSLTYITVSLTSIAETVGLDASPAADAAVRAHVVAMINQNKIHAKIDDATGMVQFLANPETFDDTATLAKLNASVASVAKLVSQIRDLDTDILLDSTYIYKTEIAPTVRGGDITDMMASMMGATAGVTEDRMASSGGGPSSSRKRGGDDPY